MPITPRGDKSAARLSARWCAASFPSAQPGLFVKIVAALSAIALASSVLAAQDTATDAGSHPPLAPFAERVLVVVPTSFLLLHDQVGWADKVTDIDKFLADFDAELEFALKDRKLGRSWILSSRLAAEYKRNQDYMADPTHLAGDFLRYPGPKKPLEYLPDPLEGELRTIIAVNDKAEFVLYPIELRFVKAPEGIGGRLALRAAIIDPRHAKIAWMGDVFSSTEKEFSPALLASLAEHLANDFARPTN